jgi:hypothetical protein
MAANDTRTLAELGSSIHGDLGRLAEAFNSVGGRAPELEPLMQNVAFVTEGLAARGRGSTPVGGERAEHNGPRDVVALSRDLHTDLTKLNARLRDLGLPPETLHGSLADAPGAIDDLVGRLLPYGSDLLYSEAPEATRAAKLNLKPVEGTTPGARPTSLDHAARALESLLRATNAPKK